MALDYFNKLADYLKEHKVECEHLRFSQSCHSVAEAALAVGVAPSDFVKSVCMEDEKTRTLIVAIIKGEDRASRANVALTLGIGKPRIASPDFMLEKSGYPAGGTPPLGYAATFLIDERVMEKDSVYCGGGSTDSLLKISPREIIKFNCGRVARVRD